MPKRVHPKAYVQLSTIGGPPASVFYPGYGRSDWLSSFEYTDDPGGTGPKVQYFDLTTNGFLPESTASPVMTQDGVHWLVPSLSAASGFPTQVQPLIVTPVFDSRGWQTEKDWGKAKRYVDAHIDLNYWEPLCGETKEYLNHFNDQQLISATMPFPTIEFDDGGADVTSGLRSRFTMPASPIMCFALWQAAPPEFNPADAQNGRCVAATFIEFGITGDRSFCLKLSNVSPPTLTWRDAQYTNGDWRFLSAYRTEGADNWGAEILKGDRWASGEQSGEKYIWLGCFANGIAISTDAFTQSTIFFPYPVQEPQGAAAADCRLPVLVKPGPIEIKHYGGKWRFAFLPVVMPVAGYVTSPVYPLAYPWGQNPKAPQVSIGQREVWDLVAGKLQYAPSALNPSQPALAVGQDVVGNATWSKLKATDFAYQYLVTVPTAADQVQCTAGNGFGDNQANKLAPGTALSFWTSRSPEVNSADYSRGSYAVANEIGLSAYVPAKGASVVQSAEAAGKTGQVELDNQAGQWAGYVQDQTPRRLILWGTWQMDDGTDEQPLAGTFNGYLGERASNQKGGKVSLSADLYDVAQFLMDAQSDGSTPPLDGWPLSNRLAPGATAWHYLFEYLGLPWVGEDLGNPTGGGIDYLNRGPLGRLLWLCDQGRSWKDFLDEIAVFAGCAGIWVENNQVVVGCPYCHAIRSGDPAQGYLYWPLHNGPDSYGCNLHDIATSGNNWGVHFPLFFNGKDGVALYGPVAEDARSRYLIYDLDPPRLMVDEKYANHVGVTGPCYVLPNLDSYTTVWADWPSIHGTGTFSYHGYCLGRAKKRAFEYEWANSSLIRTRLAMMLGPAWALRPEYLGVSIPFAPWAQVGQVFSIAGGQRHALHGKCYRIVGVEHQGISPKHPDCTKLTGRFIGTYWYRNLGGN